MTTTYTKIPKVAGLGTTYTKISGGWHLYDDTMDVYDDSQVTYDGLNHMSAWTKIAKGTGGGSAATAGLYIGFGLYTYSGGQSLGGGIWTKVTKAT